MRRAFSLLVIGLAVAVTAAGAQVVDPTPPVVACGSADGIWHADDVSIACTASDAESGVPDPAHQAFILSTSVLGGTETPFAQTGTWQVCNGADVPACATAGPIGGNKVDKKTPRNPTTIRSTDHGVGKWSRDRRVSMAFSTGVDGGSGVDGFSFAWTKVAGDEPNESKNGEQGLRKATSRTLGDGRWYFHLRTRDNVGNWSAAAHRGPYLIDGTRPRVGALAGKGKLGKSLRLRYRTGDNNDRTREQITVTRSGSAVASWKRGMAAARWGTIQSVTWKPKGVGVYRFCVKAWDQAGNVRRDCARVSVVKPAPAPSRCDPAYPTVCIPSPPPDLDCGDIPFRDFVVRSPDPHNFDGNNDGRGCES